MCALGEVGVYEENQSAQSGNFACIYYLMPLLGDSRHRCSVRVGLQKHHHQIPVGKGGVVSHVLISDTQPSE